MFQLSANFYTSHRLNTFRGKKLLKMPHCPPVVFEYLCVLTVEVNMKAFGSILQDEPGRSIPGNHHPTGVSGSLQVTVHKSRASSGFPRQWVLLQSADSCQWCSCLTQNKQPEQEEQGRICMPGWFASPQQLVTSLAQFGSVCMNSKSSEPPLITKICPWACSDVNTSAGSTRPLHPGM